MKKHARLDPFDRIAPWYRWGEYLLMGRELQRCRETLGSQKFTKFLTTSDVSPEAKWLIWGDGDGRFGTKIAQKFPEIQLESLDFSASMLELAQLRYRSLPAPKAHMQWRGCDARKWSPPQENYALVATPFFLDCFPESELAPLVEKISHALVPGGWLYLCDFHEAPSGWRKWRSRIWTFLLYRVFRALTQIPAQSLPDWNSILVKNGFERRQSELSCARLLVAELWQKSS